MNTKLVSGLLSLLVVGIVSCENSSAVSNTANNSNKAPASNASTPTQHEKESKQDSAAEEALKSAAINAYLDKNQKGWRLEGIAESQTCFEDHPCDLNLKKGIQEKVITIIVRQFYRTDGTTFWSVYEPNKIALERYKRESELADAEDQARAEGELNGREEALANLTMDDCRQVLDEAVDERDPPDPY